MDYHTVPKDSVEMEDNEDKMATGRHHCIHQTFFY